MRGVYINIASSLLNFTIGIWNISTALDNSWTLAACLAGSLSMFVAGYSGLNAWHCYQRHLRSQHDMEPCDSGVNWRRDGF